MHVGQLFVREVLGELCTHLACCEITKPLQSEFRKAADDGVLIDTFIAVTRKAHGRRASRGVG
jgi:hypothetical protein